MVRAGRETVVRELRDRIVAGIHVGRLRAGTRMPSVRTLARQYDVNERVVLGALRELASDGFIELRPRSGSYIAPLHTTTAGSLPDLGAWLVDTLVEARLRGIAPRDVSEYVRRSMETMRIQAACIECNNDQLHLLCEELTSDHGIVAHSTPLDTIRADDPPPFVRRADLLVTTAFHADQVRRLARRLGKPSIVVELRADAMRDVGHQLRAGPLYYIATDPRFEKKVRRMLAAVGPVENLRVFIVGRDELGEIPADAPTFIMPSAREAVRRRFGPNGFPGRPIQPHRHFSDASARELLSFVVRTNVAAQQAAAPPQE